MSQVVQPKNSGIQGMNNSSSSTGAAASSNNNSSFMSRLTEFFTNSSSENPMEMYLMECKEQVKSTFQENMENLSDEDYEVIDALLQKFPALVKQFNEHASNVRKNVQNMDAEGATFVMRSATRFFQDETTIHMMDRVIDRYSPVLENETTWRAVGNYVKCVLSKVDVRYKDLAVATFEAFMALYSLIRKDDRFRRFASNVSQKVHANVVTPAANVMAGGAHKKHRSRSATSSSASNSARKSGAGAALQQTRPYSAGSKQARPSSASPSPSSKAKKGVNGGASSSPARDAKMIKSTSPKTASTKQTKQSQQYGSSRSTREDARKMSSSSSRPARK